MGNKYYDEEGAKVNKSKNNNKKPDVIWTHPQTGGKVYVGSQIAASDLGILDDHEIRYVVNC